MILLSVWQLWLVSQEYKVKINQNIIHFECALLERPDGGNIFIVINGLSEQQAIIVDDPDFGQLKMQIQPKSFNTLVYYP